MPSRKETIYQKYKIKIDSNKRHGTALSELIKSLDLFLCTYSEIGIYLKNSFHSEYLIRSDYFQCFLFEILSYFLYMTKMHEILV